MVREERESARARVIALIVSAMWCALACGAPPLAVALEQPDTVLVAGTVTQADASCGGAAPPSTTVSPVNAGRPFPNKTFHLIKGLVHAADTPIVAHFTSDSSGRFSLRLAPGTYSVLVDEQVASPDPKRYEARFVKMDEACFKEWWAKPYSTLEVGPSGLTGLRFHFDHRCFISYDIPCLLYVGPLPAD
jgi:hypothetical protein